MSKIEYVVIACLFGVAACIATPIACSIADPPQGLVVSKGHREAYMTTTYIMAGKVMVPIANHHPEQWTVTVNDGGWERTATVTQSQHDSLKIGDQYP